MFINGDVIYILIILKGCWGKFYTDEYKEMLRLRMIGENNPFYNKSWERWWAS
ncbi:hypothetical protein CoNPh17_CDS0229 [Staphylococcus phage S-CoN_Ph17]|nr:hypothetical protein CoNPh17_CDS0229 [Staphylococcus phage S-CoN_Ph17]